MPISPALAHAVRTASPPAARRDVVVGAVDDPGELFASTAWAALSTAGMAVGAYHGYKRNQSIGWAVGWAVLGALFPVVVIPVAFAQGIGERA